MLLQLSRSPSLFPSALHLTPTSIPPLSSYPWVVHISSLTSPFPILFLTFCSLFCTHHLCFFSPVPLPPFFPQPLPTDNLPCELHFCDHVPVLVVCLVLFLFLGSVVDSCEFVVILLFIFLIFFLVDKFL